MKERNPRLRLGHVCQWFGITRQAYYRHGQECQKNSIEEAFVVNEARSIRRSHPRMGTRKLYEKLRPFLSAHGMKIGRDALFDLLGENGLLIRKRKQGVRTTDSHHWLRKYPNLIKETTASRPNEIWVSDITYWQIGEKKHLYISLVTDAYSRKIVGYQVADNLEAIESVGALQMALKAFEGAFSDHLPLTHHSDRGVQYCSRQYVKLLQDYQAGISMTESGDPRDNAIAERVNGIVKNEYLDAYDVEDLEEARSLLDHAIWLYNNERPHGSIGNHTPEFVHSNDVQTKRLWKNYYPQKTNIANQWQDEEEIVNLI